jgi:enoyl-CoA hydratase
MQIDMFEFDVSDRIATVILNRPPANAINLTWVGQFHAVLDQLGRREDWNVLHIRSALRLFSGGADIKEMRAAFESGAGVDSLVAAVRDYQELFSRIEKLPQITLAEIGGAAMGGGFELALSCDLRIISDDARVGLPEIRIGLLAGAGGTQRLTRLCGRATATRLLLGAEMVNGPTAVELGLAQWRAPAGELREAALRIATRYADQNVQAARLAKGCINAALDPTSSRGFDLEFEGSKALFESDETRALIYRFLASNAAK